MPIKDADETQTLLSAGLQILTYGRILGIALGPDVRLDVTRYGSAGRSDPSDDAVSFDADTVPNS